MYDMKLTQKSRDGLTNYYCLKCELTVGALGGSAAWCKNGHRMFTKQDIEAAEARRLEREAKKNGKSS